MIPGNGFRLANDVLLEISLHLAQPILYTTTLTPVTAFTPQTFTVASLGIPTNACYVGAQLLVVDSVNGNEVIALTAVNTSTSQLMAGFAYPHPAGTVICGATWPLQQATDPVFTQVEGLSYLSRAQNEFLSQCPVVYTQSSQQATIGVIFQSSPSEMIEMERVSFSTQSLSGASLSRDGAGNVTATFTYPHGLVQNQTFTVYQSTDTSFLGAFQVASVTSPEVVVWLQDGAAATSSSASLGIFNRLYEITQEEQTMQERTWRNDFFIPPTGWFEDRAGNYQWGLNAAPQGNFPMNLWWSTRDTDTLSLLDGFVVPDCMVPYVKYKAMEYFYSKDGVLNSPKMASYSKMRFDRGVMITNRFFQGEQMGLEARRG